MSAQRALIMKKKETTKLVIFDLDGVLIDSRDIHYDALNRALATIDRQFLITIDEHLSYYDGLSTSVKLNLLTSNKGLPREVHNQIWQAKQEATLDLFSELTVDDELVELFAHLRSQGFKLAVASNSIRNTVALILSKLGLIKHVDFFISNQDVTRSKPNPEMYWHCMIACNALPRDTVIIEDSHIGRQAASDSGAHLIAVENRKDLNRETADLISEALSTHKSPIIAWKSKNMNVLIPMAGAGSRFAAMGYTFPKPLVEVNGKPMIQVVVENLNIEANYIFIVQKEHYERYNLKYLLNIIAPSSKVVQVNGITEGAACTTLLAKELINTDAPLVIANSDQFVDWDSNECLYAFSAADIDGGIVTFNSSHPKWSYVKLSKEGFVCEVAEKKPISTHATVGIYFWKRGSEYVKYAERMIDKNIRVNNEFYVCPVFNEALLDGKKIRIKEATKMWGLGTPEELNYFTQNYTFP
jgi:HAD superfamily hydrolase (TIGR01509 family)